MGTVTYQKTVSDTHLHQVLQRMSDVYGKDITVHSGDRDNVPAGGSKTSLHLARRAADFHISGLEDQDVFHSMRQHLAQVFTRSEGYEFILHGAHTATGGPHLHLGHYAAKNQGKVIFKTEGLTPATKGHYSLEEVPIPATGAPPQPDATEAGGTQTILASVGEGGVNSEADVKVVQGLLNAAQEQLKAAHIAFTGFEPLPQNGKAGPRTKEAISLFQKEIMQMANPDSRVDPNGRTLRTLQQVVAGHIPAGAGQASGSISAGPSGNLTSSSPAEELVKSPLIKAMLDVLAFTEGTGDNYGKVVNGEVISSPLHPNLVGKRNVSVTDLSRHPEILVKVNASINSTAAGRYQFLKKTWDELNMPDFSPLSQDIAAVKLMKGRGMIDPLLNGKLRQAVFKGAPEWASLPTEGGGSHFGGQPARTIAEIEKEYARALAKHQGASPS